MEPESFISEIAAVRRFVDVCRERPGCVVLMPPGEPEQFVALLDRHGVEWLTSPDVPPEKWWLVDRQVVAELMELNAGGT